MGLMDIFSSRTVDKAVDGIYNGVDMAIYSDEEKAIAQQKATDTKLKMLPLYEPFKLAQRYMAFAFTINFLLSFWVAVLIWVFMEEKKLSEYLTIVATFQLGWIMLTIVGFYYSGGFVESFKNKFIKGK